MDSFTFNKIAGAVLAALLIGFLVIEVSHMLYPSPRHAAHVEEMGYPVAAAHAEDGHADAEPEPEPDLGTMLAEANPTRGEAAVRTCTSCHSFNEGGPNGTGPNLWGVVGRPVASHEGFGYSRAMQAFGGNWTYERLFDYLQHPRDTVPGTTMSFAGVRRDSQRADILAYLRTLSNDPVPFPAPAPAVEEAADPGEDAMHEAGEAMEGAAEDTMDAADEAAEDAMDHGEDMMDEAAAEDMGEAAEDAADDAMGEGETTE